MNKLKGFPSIYYLSLEESQDRREFLSEQFSEYDIENVTGIISKRFAQCNDIIEGNYVDTLTDQSKGSIISHIKALHKWLTDTSDEEYAFFCEDDVSFETVKYWDFTWEEFIENLPNEWEVVQLLIVRDDFEKTFEFRSRYWNDWALAAYIIRRDYAQSLVDRYYIDGKYVFNTDQDGHVLQPIGENVIYIPSKNCYSVPLFVEEVYKFNTTLTGVNDFDGTKDGFEMLDGQGKSHITSYHDVISWYKKNDKVSLNVLMKKYVQEEIDMSMQIGSCEVLHEYIYDTENSRKNFNLARWYHEKGQTAAAITHYLRSADRSKDPLLSYECLLLMASCFDKQQNRDYTVKGLYQHAISTLPKRPEAYFHLARYEECRKQYSECYTTCSIALSICDFDCEPLSVDLDYPGKYGIIHQKALSAYWWGKGQETRVLLKDLLENYEMTDEYVENIKNNLTTLKIEF